MQIIPAIDLLDGDCVRLHQGDYGQVTRFSSDPVAQALSWQEQGARRLHLVDLDGAKSGLPVNDAVVKAIAAALSIPVKRGGVRSWERATELLAWGLDRVILGTMALEQPELVEKLAAAYPGQIVVGIDARNGKVATRGWIEESPTEATALAQRFAGRGIAAIISTDIATDCTLAGPNLEALRAMAEASACLRGHRQPGTPTLLACARTPRGYGRDRGPGPLRRPGRAGRGTPSHREWAPARPPRKRHPERQSRVVGLVRWPLPSARGLPYNN